MKYLTIILTFIVCFISILGIMGIEYFIDNFFLVPLIESIIIFWVILFLLKFTNENYFSVVFLFGIFFILLENSIYAIAIALNMVEGAGLTLKNVLSWRFLYNSLFILIYFPLLGYGLKKDRKDKFFVFLFFLLGVILHIIYNLIMHVIS